MKLYFNPRSRAVIAKWLLDECDAEYELVPIDFKQQEHKAPEYLKINPAGKLPALVDGETRIFENVAIGLYLADKYPAARLAPKLDEPGRGRYLSLMVFATSQLEPAMGEALGGKEHSPFSGWNDYATTVQVVESELGDGPWLFGDWFTAADIMIGSMFIWKQLFGKPEERPIIKAYVERLLERPKGMKAGG